MDFDNISWLNLRYYSLKEDIHWFQHKFPSFQIRHEVKITDISIRLELRLLLTLSYRIAVADGISVMVVYRVYQFLKINKRSGKCMEN